MNGNYADTGKSVSAIVIESGKVLLTWREGADGQRRLTLPGGPACPGKAPEEALAIYVKEQTGIDVSAYTLAGFHFGLECWNAGFNCRVVGGSLSDNAQYMGVNEALSCRELGDLTRLMLAGHDRALEKNEIFGMKNDGSLYL